MNTLKEKADEPARRLRTDRQNVLTRWSRSSVQEGYPIQPEDVARLSPLVFEHINLLARYAFSVPDSVVRGQLRPLRNPADALEDVA